MNRLLYSLFGSLIALNAFAQTPTKSEMRAIYPAVTVGDVVPGVFGCPYPDAPTCQRPTAFNLGRLTVPDETPFRMADPYRTGGHCSLDAVNGRAPIFDVMRVKRASRLKVDGWAFNDVQMPDETVLMLTNSAVQYRATVSRIVPRPDVAAYFKIPSLVNSGYIGDIGLSHVPDGIYDVSVFMLSGNAVTICHTGKKIKITSE
jgi:hypothetical protein